jgi:hypothetical protein
MDLFLDPRREKGDRRLERLGDAMPGLDVTGENFEKSRQLGHDSLSSFSPNTPCHDAAEKNGAHPGYNEPEKISSRNNGAESRYAGGREKENPNLSRCEGQEFFPENSRCGFRGVVQTEPEKGGNGTNEEPG